MTNYSLSTPAVSFVRAQRFVMLLLADNPKAGSMAAFLPIQITNPNKASA
jgi:hypothetical protein